MVRVTLSQDEGKDDGTGPNTCGFSPERLGVPGGQDEKRLAGLQKGGEGRGQALGGVFWRNFIGEVSVWEAGSGFQSNHTVGLQR